MIQIHPKIREQFDTPLLQKNILKKHHADYRKWLRYYLDFCNKYYDSLKKESLPHFIKKLRNKKQAITQQRQAHHAVSIYYQIEGSNSIKEKTIARKDNPSFIQSEGLKIINADWTSVYDKLNDEIKL